MKRSHGYQLHFDSVDFRWDENQYAYRKVTLDDLLLSSKREVSNKEKTNISEKLLVILH